MRDVQRFSFTARNPYERTCASGALLLPLLPTAGAAGISAAGDMGVRNWQATAAEQPRQQPVYLWAYAGKQAEGMPRCPRSHGAFCCSPQRLPAHARACISQPRAASTISAARNFRYIPLKLSARIDMGHGDVHPEGPAATFSTVSAV